MSTSSNRGEIITILTIGTFLVLGIATLLSSTILKNQSPTQKSKAASNCSQYPGVPAPNPQASGNSSGYYWQATCDESAWCPNNINGGGCPKNTSQGEVNPDSSAWCYGFDDGARCMQLKYGMMNVSTPTPTTQPNISATPTPGVDPAFIEACVRDTRVYYEQASNICTIETSNPTNKGCGVRSNTGVYVYRSCTFIDFDTFGGSFKQPGGAYFLKYQCPTTQRNPDLQYSQVGRLNYSDNRCINYFNQGLVGDWKNFNTVAGNPQITQSIPQPTATVAPTPTEQASSGGGNTGGSGNQGGDPKASQYATCVACLNKSADSVWVGSATSTDTKNCETAFAKNCPSDPSKEFHFYSCDPANTAGAKKDSDLKASCTAQVADPLQCNNQDSFIEHIGPIDGKCYYCGGHSTGRAVEEACSGSVQPTTGVQSPTQTPAEDPNAGFDTFGTIALHLPVLKQTVANVKSNIADPDVNKNFIDKYLSITANKKEIERGFNDEHPKSTVKSENGNQNDKVNEDSPETTITEDEIIQKFTKGIRRFFKPLGGGSRVEQTKLNVESQVNIFENTTAFATFKNVTFDKVEQLNMDLYTDNNYPLTYSYAKFLSVLPTDQYPNQFDIKNFFHYVIFRIEKNDDPGDGTYDSNGNSFQENIVFEFNTAWVTVGGARPFRIAYKTPNVEDAVHNNSFIGSANVPFNKGINEYVLFFQNNAKDISLHIKYHCSNRQGSIEDKLDYTQPNIWDSDNKIHTGVNSIFFPTDPKDSSNGQNGAIIKLKCNI